MVLFGESKMTLYYNEHHATHAEMNSGPYLFKFGLIKTDESADKTVGPILTNFYGCVEVSESEATALMKKHKSSVAAEAKKAADDAAKTIAEAEAKAKAEAEAKAKAEAEAKAKAEAAANLKPEDKM